MLAVLSESEQLLAATAVRMAATAEIANPADIGVVTGDGLWGALDEAGLLALRAADGPAGARPAAPAGSGLDAALVAEALGATLAPVPFVGATLVADLLRRAGASLDPPHPARCGVLLGADRVGLATVAELEAAWAWEADGATTALALAPVAPGGDPFDPAGAGARVVRVTLDDRWRWMPSADLTRTVAHPPEDGEVAWTPVGAPVAVDDLRRWLALALALVSADAVGVMGAALREAVAYARERVQYGVPVGSFQAVQHLCADAHVSCVGAGGAMRHAAWAVDVLDPAEALRAARVAKAPAAAAGVAVAEVAMQVHGGIGQTWEHLCHVRTRRLLSDAQVLGAREHHLEHLADDLRAGLVAG